MARELDFRTWGKGGDYNPLMKASRIAPGEVYAFGYLAWYDKGGLYGNPAANKVGINEPPINHPLRRAMEIQEEIFKAPTLEERRELYRKIQDIAAENVWNINVSTPPPWLGIVKNGFKNVPRKLLYAGGMKSPANGGMETFYFENPDDSLGAIAQIKREMVEITPSAYAIASSARGKSSGFTLSRIVRHLVLGIFLVGGILIGINHPYIGRRLLIMIPTLFVISIITFIIIQLPPSNFIDMKELQAELHQVEQYKIEAEELRQLFPQDEPMSKQYFRWLGLYWFTSFSKEDHGLLQGHMGYSMESRNPVNEVVGDRLVLTFLISLGSILITWAVAMPIGIYSAVRQYSIGDYLFAFLGFLGMCIPSFLLALIIMYWNSQYFGIHISGLFSPEYVTQPEWTWGKVADLMKHIWIPVLVLGVSGTASMIRVMRGNLLDELSKPYVTTALAKGVRPFKLLMKYPVRVAHNPFISGIGAIFPALVSGGAIVAIVLSLPHRRAHVVGISDDRRYVPGGFNAYGFKFTQCAGNLGERFVTALARPENTL